MNKNFTDYLGELVRQLLDTNHDVTIEKNGILRIICDEKVIDIPFDKHTTTRVKKYLKAEKLQKKIELEKQKNNSI